jgi:multimeric flavodoxin WrbA
MVTIIADEENTRIGSELYQALVSQGTQADYVSLENANVKPCVNCGGCTYKTYGRCVTRDDGDWIYPKILRADMLLLVTPVVFGSYSFKLKRVIDKFGLFMDRHYYMSNGEIAKGGLPDRTFKCFAVGVSDDAAQAEVFKKLFRELLVITRGAGKAFVTGASLPSDIKSEILMEVARV